jgi:hypothetical protein
VSIKADDWVLDHACWSAALRADRKTRLEKATATFEMLRVSDA